MLTDYDFRRPFRVCGLDHTFIKRKKGITPLQCLTSAVWSLHLLNRATQLMDAPFQLGSGLTWSSSPSSDAATPKPSPSLTDSTSRTENYPTSESPLDSSAITCFARKLFETIESRTTIFDATSNPFGDIHIARTSLSETT
jgi:hypothetical protein